MMNSQSRLARAALAPAAAASSWVLMLWCGRHKLKEDASYAVLGTSTTLCAIQFHGSSVANSFCLVRPVTIRSSTSVSQASGST